MYYCKTISVCLLWCSLTVVISTSVTEQLDETECIPLKNCPYALNLVFTQKEAPATLNFLRKAHCGYSSKNEPLIKCPNSIQNQKYCFTPDGKNGTCKEIKDCDSILNTDVKQENTEICRHEDDTTILICCYESPYKSFSTTKPEGYVPIILLPEDSSLTEVKESPSDPVFQEYINELNEEESGTNDVEFDLLRSDERMRSASFEQNQVDKYDGTDGVKISRRRKRDSLFDLLPFNLKLSTERKKKKKPKYSTQHETSDSDGSHQKEGTDFISARINLPTRMRNMVLDLLDVGGTQNNDEDEVSEDSTAEGNEVVDQVVTEGSPDIPEILNRIGTLPLDEGTARLQSELLDSPDGLSEAIKSSDIRKVVSSRNRGKRSLFSLSTNLIPKIGAKTKSKSKQPINPSFITSAITTIIGNTNKPTNERLIQPGKLKQSTSNLEKSSDVRIVTPSVENREFETELEPEKPAGNTGLPTAEVETDDSTADTKNVTGDVSNHFVISTLPSPESTETSESSQQLIEDLNKNVTTAAEETGPAVDLERPDDSTTDTENENVTGDVSNNSVISSFPSTESTEMSESSEQFIEDLKGNVTTAAEGTRLPAVDLENSDDTTMNTGNITEDVSNNFVPSTLPSSESPETSELPQQLIGNLIKNVTTVADETELRAVDLEKSDDSTTDTENVTGHVSNNSAISSSSSPESTEMSESSQRLMEDFNKDVTTTELKRHPTALRTSDLKPEQSEISNTPNGNSVISTPPPFGMVPSKSSKSRIRYSDAAKTQLNHAPVVALSAIHSEPVEPERSEQSSIPMTKPSSRPNISYTGEFAVDTDGKYPSREHLAEQKTAVLRASTFSEEPHRDSNLSGDLEMKDGDQTSSKIYSLNFNENLSKTEHYAELRPKIAKLRMHQKGERLDELKNSNASDPPMESSTNSLDQKIGSKKVDVKYNLPLTLRISPLETQQVDQSNIVGRGNGGEEELRNPPSNLDVNSEAGRNILIQTNQIRPPPKLFRNIDNTPDGDIKYTSPNPENMDGNSPKSAGVVNEVIFRSKNEIEQTDESTPQSSGNSEVYDLQQNYPFSKYSPVNDHSPNDHGLPRKNFYNLNSFPREPFFPQYNLENNYDYADYLQNREPFSNYYKYYARNDQFDRPRRMDFFRNPRENYFAPFPRKPPNSVHEMYRRPFPTRSFMRNNDVELIDLSEFPNMRPVDGENFSCGREFKSVQNSMIIGGNPVALNGYPWMALIQYTGKSGIINGCGGSIISSSHILTAAHCVDSEILATKNIKLYRVVLGEYNTLTDPDCVILRHRAICAEPARIFHISSIIKHTNFDKKEAFNDIALIKLDREIQFSDFIKPVCLPPKTFSYEVNDSVTVAGWGRKDEIDGWSPILNEAVLPMVDRESCSKHDVTMTEGQICIGLGMGVDTCTGDSGGPIMVQKTEGTRMVSYQIGIISYGFAAVKCGEAPSVNTYIPFYLDWISSQLSA